MNKNSSQNKDSKKNIKSKKFRWIILIISFFTIIFFYYLWQEDSREVNDLSLIGNGENVIVQVHDPG